MSAEVERIRKINSKKKYGHIDSAVSHCAFLLTEIDRLNKEVSTNVNAARIFGEEVHRLRTLIADWHWMDIPSRERLQDEAEKIRQERSADALEKT